MTTIDQLLQAVALGAFFFCFLVLLAGIKPRYWTLSRCQLMIFHNNDSPAEQP